MEPLTRIELVTSPLPRGCSTAKLQGPGFPKLFRLLLQSKHPDGHLDFLSFSLIYRFQSQDRFGLGLFEFLRNLPDWYLRRFSSGSGSEKKWWAELDSNQCRLSPANLQSASFSHSDICPQADDGIRTRNLRFTKPLLYH